MILVCKNLPRIIVGRELLCGGGLARRYAHESRGEAAPASRAQLAAEVVAARADGARGEDERQHVSVQEHVEKIDAPQAYVDCRERPVGRDAANQRADACTRYAVRATGATYAATAFHSKAAETRSPKIWTISSIAWARAGGDHGAEISGRTSPNGAIIDIQRLSHGCMFWRCSGPTPFHVRPGVRSSEAARSAVA